VPGTSYFADLARHPENERIPDVLVIRTEGSLLYFNIDHVRDRLLAVLNERAVPPRLVVFFMGNVPYVDLAGAEALLDLRLKLAQRGIELRLAEVHGEVREAMHRLGSEHASGLAEANQTVDDVLRKWRVTPLPA
jgi:MFS superfamily sulfate permease-like transporter